MTTILASDTIDLSVRGADLLCQNSPLVCAVEFNRSSDRRRTRASLLEGGMFDKAEYMREYRRSGKAYSVQIKYNRTHPWAKTLKSILTRCNNKAHPYHKKGIKNFLNLADLKYLWFRDEPYLMKRPSIDRKNSKKHYTLENCRYIELSENSRLGGLIGGVNRWKMARK